jgi:flagellar biosynthesis protein FlhF
MNAIVKTFRGPDPRTALDAVRSALGEEAIILKTREVGGFFGRKQIEITATHGGRGEPGYSSRGEPASLGGPIDLESEVSALRRIVDQLRAEVRSNKAEPRIASVRTDDGLVPAAAAVMRRLVERGAEPALADELVRAAVRAAAGYGEREIAESLREGLRRRLTPALPPWQGEGRRVIALVGPPGVGKTTTIAKIAARALLESKLKVALVTVDTYRIGAKDHIGRYGEIMGVPTHVARDQAGLREAIAAEKEAQLVLIDTAGRSDPAALGAQAQLLKAAPEAEQHLVLSAATGGRELRAAVRRFKARGVVRVIFTKLDEADGPAGVLSVASELTCPVSCVTDGQKVPDDVHPATSPLLVELVMGKGD